MHEEIAIGISDARNVVWRRLSCFLDISDGHKAAVGQFSRKNRCAASLFFVILEAEASIFFHFL